MFGVTTRTRTAVGLDESKWCASGTLSARACQHPSRAPACEAAHLLVTLMALLKPAIPIFLTFHRSLTQVPSFARRFSRARRYSDAANRTPPSTAARRRVPLRLSSSAAQNGGLRRLLRLENLNLVCGSCGAPAARANTLACRALPSSPLRCRGHSVGGGGARPCVALFPLSPLPCAQVDQTMSLATSPPSSGRRARRRVRAARRERAWSRVHARDVGV